MARQGEAAKEAVVPLVWTLKDGDKHPRTFPALALAMIGPAGDAAVPALTAAVLEYGSDAVSYQYVRGAAALALGAIGRTAAPAVPELLASLRDPITARHPRHVAGCPSQRAAAAYALGRIAPDAPAVRAALAQAGNDRDWLVRHVADKASRDPAALGAPRQAEGEVFGRALRVVGRAGERYVRESVSVAIGCLGTRTALDFASPGLTRHEVEKRDSVLAIRALGKVNRDAVPALLLRLTN